MIFGIDYQVRTPEPAELNAVQRLRHAVLDPGRHTSSELTTSLTDLAPETIHAAAFIGERVISTVRLNPLGFGEFLVRKMATLEEYRGDGIGGAVLAFAETRAWMHGATHFTLDARERAIPFYRRLGYTETGDEVDRSGILHYTMSKRGLIHGR